MDEISDRMTEISEILDAPDDGDDVEALEAEYNALDAEHDRLSDTDLLIPTQAQCRHLPRAGQGWSAAPARNLLHRSEARAAAPRIG
jgi:hypothetical protein